MYSRLTRQLHVVLRLANVYGPRQNSDGEGGVVAIFCDRASLGRKAKPTPLTIYGTGNQTRDFVYVTDVARAFWLAATSEHPGIYNIGTGIETRINELADLCTDGKIVHEQGRAGEVQRSVLDPSKANTDLFWYPSVDLMHGLGQVLAWVALGSYSR